MALVGGVPYRRALSGLRHTTAGLLQRSTFMSVTGTIYEGPSESPKLTLFTKEQCSLCDDVKEILDSVRNTHPHTLEAIDITDAAHKEWHRRYKYDIPVLHIDGQYWTKHRLDAEQAVEGISEAISGHFQAKDGDPNP